jgi:alpha-tubulin suppressor-like RCC1 family protein
LGQLGNGNQITPQTAPVLASALGVASISGGDFEVAVSSSLTNSCAFLNTASLGPGFKCWGGNDFAQLGTGSAIPVSSTVPVSATILNGKKIKQFTVGDFHACVLFADDSSALCWGKNDYGQLGDGTTTNRETGVSVNSTAINNEAIRSIAASDFMTCIITFSNNGYCWGNATKVQNFQLSANPTLIISGAAYVSGGDASHVCFIMLDQTVQCVGNNDKGQLGNGKMTSSVGAITPFQVLNLIGASMIVAGESHTCAVTNNNTVVSCWGDNSDGQLGNDDSGVDKAIALPLKVIGLPEGSKIVDIASADVGSCVLLSNDDVYCWGNTGSASLTSDKAQKILNRADP